MTPISATGDKRRFACAAGGFSMVELVLTLAIMALAVSAVMLTLPDQRPTLAQEAARLAARLERAQEAAIVESRAFAVEVSPAGYSFSARQEGVWRPLSRPPFATVAWQPGSQPELSGGGPVRIVFDPVGGADPADLRLRRDGAVARVRVSAAGEAWVDDDAAR